MDPSNAAFFGKGSFVVTDATGGMYSFKPGPSKPPANAYLSGHRLRQLRERGEHQVQRYHHRFQLQHNDDSTPHRHWKRKHQGLEIFVVIERLCRQDCGPSRWCWCARLGCYVLVEAFCFLPFHSAALTQKG